MPFPYIDDLLNSLNDFEKKSVKYHFAIKNTAEDLVLRNYILLALTSNINSQRDLNVNRMLKSRAFNQITDILTSDYHIHNKGNFVAQDQILLHLKKRMLLTRIISKSLNQHKLGPFKTILSTIITEAEKNEVYEVLIEALILKKYVFALKEGLFAIQKIEKKIAYFENCQKRVYYAGDCYFKIIINSNLLKFKNNKQFHNYIVRAIRLLKQDYLTYKSQQINYYLHIILMYYYERQKKYALSAKYCKTLFSIVKSSPVIYRTERLGLALINLSQYKTFTKNYNDAARYAKESQKYYIENSNNYMISKEQEFNIYFYHKKYDKSEMCIKELLSHKLVDTGNFSRSKYIYYNSALLFAQKKYKQALAQLNKSLELEKEKSKWNISLKIMTIMLSIELNKIDEASRSLESLRKYVHRHEKSSEIKIRDIKIVKLLRELEKEGFNYNPDDKVVSKLLKELAQKNKPISWEHYSPELIPFHEWLEGKMQTK